MVTEAPAYHLPTMSPGATLPVHVALLRGINVGGKNKLPMRDLVAMFGNAGCDDVRSYIQSGNVVFRASEALAARLPALISAAIAEDFGIQVPVILRSAAELRAVSEGNPYLARGADAAALHVMFLAAEPAAERAAVLDPQRSAGDSFELLGREIYLHCPNGVARTKLTNDYFDRTLRTISTGRNWNTVLHLRDMSAAG